MADAETPNSSPGRLQFRRAEYAQDAPGQVSCAGCGRTIHDYYFDVDGATTCERCRRRLDLGQGDEGGLARFGRALAFGLAAAFVSSLAWFGISKLTGYEFGILAIVVGLFVGGAVRAGSRQRGGARYQFLAMWLTYSAIVVTYIPAILESAGAASETAAPGASAASVGDPAETRAATTVSTEPTVSTGPTAADAVPASAEGAESLGPMGVVLGLGLLLLIAYVAPVLVVFSDVSAIMGVIIIAIALYEAWKMNRRREPEITGPHRIGAGSAIAGA